MRLKTNRISAQRIYCVFPTAGHSYGCARFEMMRHVEKSDRCPFCTPQKKIVCLRTTNGGIIKKHIGKSFVAATAADAYKIGEIRELGKAGSR